MVYTAFGLEYLDSIFKLYLLYQKMASNIVNFKLLCKFYHTTVQNAAIHKTFRKVMGNSSKKRKFIYQDTPIFHNDVTKLEKGGSSNKNSSRRASMLNKMFMRNVTDLMVNSEFWDQYAELGIEINRIQVSPDYKSLNIFWITKETEKDELITRFLSENAYTLRHELSQLRLMGNVPPIVFVKDKQQSQEIELDRRMSTADFGEDYEPASITRLKHRLQLYAPLEENIKKQIENLEIEEEDDTHSDLPKMPQNVLGLNHAEIFNKIQKINKNLESRRKSLDNETVNVSEEIEKMTSAETIRSFLQKRQLAQQKMNKQKKNYNPDMEYIKQELMEKSSSEYYHNIDNNIDQFGEDSIEEDLGDSYMK